MNTKELSCFIATAEQGGIRSAARALTIPQPAVTRAIQSLERQLGVTLLTRRADGILLTAEGRRFLTRARLITAEAKKAKEELQQTKATYVGEVHAALSIMPHLHLFPSAVRSFSLTYPRVKLHIKEALLPAVADDLRTGQIDFYVGAIPDHARESDLRITHLMNNQRVVVGRREHPLRLATSLKELGHMQWAVPDVDHDPSAELQILFRTRGLPPPEVSLYGKTAMSILMALTDTNLLAMLPQQWATNPLTQDWLAVFPITDPLPAPPIGLAVSDRLPLTPPADHFLDLLRRRLV